MTNTKLFLLLGTSLSLIPTITFAQCVATQDCAALGYTQTSCTNGNGIKCPFGNKWACLPTKDSICKEEGFTLACNGTGQTGVSDSCGGLYKKCSCDSSYQYTCTGTGYTGGSGTACGGKYTACTCSSGYEWKNSACSKINTCTIGALYYSDGTCSSNKVNGKTILGVIIMEKTAGANGWIIAINPIQQSIAWSSEGYDIPGVLTTSSEAGLTDIQASCTNTDAITTYGDSSKYPLTWAAKNYKPTGTPSGKTWCQPSGGLLKSALNNSTNFAKVNVGINTAGGTKIGNVSGGRENIWSSSENNAYDMWGFEAYSSGSFTMSIYRKYYGNTHGSIRPVLPF